MGKTLAAVALEAGHEVLIVSGPVNVAYPEAATVIDVVSTEDMLAACEAQFDQCDGLIGVAAPCDYRPQRVEGHKITKTGEPLVLHLIETPDVVATLAARRRADQWVVGFALETEDHRFRAITKLERKRCDLIVLNRPQAMHADSNEVEVFDPAGQLVLAAKGLKQNVSREVFHVIQTRLIT